MVKQTHTTLYYISDPLCSWCYGFSSEISQVTQALEQLPFKLVMGGLRPHGQERISAMKDFLTEHWQHVHQRSGLPFNHTILEHPTFIYDTEPPCRAVVTARNLQEGMALDFLHRVQIAFYQENKDTGEFATYREIAADLYLDVAAFDHLFHSPEAKIETAQDFEWSHQLGIRGFPSVILKTEEGLHLIARGYTTAQVLMDRISQLLKAQS